MQTEMMKEWVQKIWGPYEDDVSHLLILDCDPIYKSLKIALAYLPTLERENNGDFSNDIF